MFRYFLSIRAFCLAAAAAALLAAGCGGSSEGGSGGEVAVETGSLTKAQFIEQANAICKTARSQFNREYAAFVKSRNSQPSSASEQANWIVEIVNTILLPNYERRIDEIGSLGAPDADKQEVTAFLAALQQRLDEMRSDPAELSRTVTPFAKPAKVAEDYGLDGCAASFS